MRKKNLFIISIVMLIILLASFFFYISARKPVVSITRVEQIEQKESVEENSSSEPERVLTSDHIQSVSEPVMRESAARQNASIDEIVEKVLKATVPDWSYKVEVVQLFTNMVSDVSNTSAAGAVIKPPDRQVFNISFDPARGCFISGDGSDKENNVSAQDGNLQVVLDIGRMMRELSVKENMAVEEVVDNGREVFRVYGGSPDNFQCALWVDVEHAYVYRVLVEIGGKMFSDARIQYERNGNDCWLPSNITIDHAAGARITQEFGEYEKTTNEQN